MESKSLAHSTNMAKSLKLFRSLHFWAIFYYYCQELHTKIEIPRRIFILKNQYRLDRTYTPMFPRIKLCILYTFFGFQQMYVASRVAQNAWSLQILAPQLFFERFIYEMITVWISDHFFKISLYPSEVEVEKRHSNFAQKINERVGLMTWIGIIMSIGTP